MATKIDSIGTLEKAANDIISSLNIQKAPIPIQEIIKNQGVSLIPYDLGDEVSGICIFNEDHCTIGFNSKHSKNRQRFTMAHELGHFVLHKESDSIFLDKDFLVKYRSDKNYNPQEVRQEQQANAFAAAILMPRSFIHAEVNKLEYKDLTESELIDKLADLFDVSVLAMTYRLSNIMQLSESW